MDASRPNKVGGDWSNFVRKKAVLQTSRNDQLTSLYSDIILIDGKNDYILFIATNIKPKDIYFMFF